MIPNVVNQEIKIVTIPSKSYGVTGDRIRGYVDNKESLKQTIFRILNTKRYAYPIYSWNYGIELDDLFGKSRDYVTSELKRRIQDALSVDDRINSVGDFEFTYSGKSIICCFTVNTIYGDIEEELNV